MILDDIFFGKPKESKESKFQKSEIFWVRCTIITGLIPVLIMIGGAIFNNDYELLFIGIVAMVVTPLFFVAFPLSVVLSYIIPYRGFSRDERKSIYFWITGCFSYLIYWVLFVDLIFNDLALLDLFF